MKLYHVRSIFFLSPIWLLGCNRAKGKSSPESREEFDIPREDWSIVGADDEKVSLILDGDPNTAWHQSKDEKMPVDLVIDPGEVPELHGFRYCPDQGEFSNIKNNPVWQIKRFNLVKARYIKLRALNNTQDDHEAGYAEVDVITN
jgi:alpha-L-fucosidase